MLIRVILLMMIFISISCQSNVKKGIDMSDRFIALNIFGEALLPCCDQPMTGFYRDGYCNTGVEDSGLHTVCAVMDKEFLDYSLAQGNDLITPKPERNFPGLEPGDKWCLCLTRWHEAYKAGLAPKVDPKATHKLSLELVPFSEILRHETQYK